MMNIDIERLIDAVAACNEAYNEYCYSSKTLYRGPFEEITTRKNHVNYAREVHDREQNAVDTLAEVFQMDTETRNRLYIAARGREPMAERYAVGAAYPGHHARPDPPVYLRRTRST